MEYAYVLKSDKRYICIKKLNELEWIERMTPMKKKITRRRLIFEENKN
jgi:hypothetical protein